MTKKDPEILLERPEPSTDEVMDRTMNGFFNGFRQTCAFFAAIDLKLFEHTGSPHTASELAENINIDTRLAEPFFNMLVEMGMLCKSDSRYINTKASSLYFTEGSPFSQLTNIGQISKRVKRWMMIDESLRSGGIEAESDLFTEKWITAIGEGALGGEIADTLEAVSKKVDIAKMGSLIDIGGGHALYAIAFKHRYPNLECSLFDQAVIAPIARRNISDYGVDVKVQEGDFYKDRITGTYDVVFSSYNRSGMDPVMAPIVYELMRPGGFLVIKRPISRMFDPIRTIEWSIVTNTGASKNKNPQISGVPDEYLRSMESMGARLLSKEAMGNATEMVILQKAGI